MHIWLFVCCPMGVSRHLSHTEAGPEYVGIKTQVHNNQSVIYQLLTCFEQKTTVQS